MSIDIIRYFQDCCILIYLEDSENLCQITTLISAFNSWLYHSWKSLLNCLTLWHKSVFTVTHTLFYISFPHCWSIGVSTVGILEKIDHVITAQHYMLKIFLTIGHLQAHWWQSQMPYIYTYIYVYCWRVNLFICLSTHQAHQGWILEICSPLKLKEDYLLLSVEDYDI